jgi:TetR/AcrR family transcriptional repressor of nem operon
VPEKLGALEAPGASLAELRGYFDGLVSDLLTPEGRIGCLKVNSTVELAAQDSKVARVVSGHMRRLERNARRAPRTRSGPARCVRTSIRPPRRPR